MFNFVKLSDSSRLRLQSFLIGLVVAALGGGADYLASSNLQGDNLKSILIGLGLALATTSLTYLHGKAWYLIPSPLSDNANFQMLFNQVFDLLGSTLNKVTHSHTNEPVPEKGITDSPAIVNVINTSNPTEGPKV